LTKDEMHPNEKAINDYVKEELRQQVREYLDEHDKKQRKGQRKWNITITLMLIIILSAMLYIAYLFNRWDQIWTAKDERDKQAMQKYLKEMDDWKNTDNKENNNAQNKRIH
jgi:flagellar basal body-associated protein FliL